MTAPVSITFKPDGEHALAFMRDSSFVRGIRGPFGSGKSTCCVMEILRRAQEMPKGVDGRRRSRWAIIRNTYPELKTTTIKTWHQWVPPHLGRWVDAGPPSHTIDEGELYLEVVFVALDRPQDVRRLLGTELTGAWINEAREVPKAVVDGATGRLGRYPSKMMMPPGVEYWHGLIMDTNPPDTDHWWYKLAEEEHPQGWRFFAQPSGLSPQAENLRNLPPDYYTRQVAGKSEDWIKVYIRGEYGFVREGKPIYPQFVDSVHVREFELIPSLPIRVGIDFGLTPAAVFFQRTSTGQTRFSHEIATLDMGAKQLGRLMRQHMAEWFPGYQFANITGDPAGDARAQGDDEITAFKMLAAEGIDARPASTNDFGIRVEAITSLLTRMVDGQPALLVHPRCTVLRKGMAGGYNYKRVQVAGDERFHDKPDKNHYSHVCEAAQYGVLGAGDARTVVERVQTAPRQVTAVSDYNYFGV